MECWEWWSNGAMHQTQYSNTPSLDPAYVTAWIEQPMRVKLILNFAHQRKRRGRRAPDINRLFQLPWRNQHKRMTVLLASICDQLGKLFSCHAACWCGNPQSSCHSIRYNRGTKSIRLPTFDRLDRICD